MSSSELLIGETAVRRDPDQTSTIEEEGEVMEEPTAKGIPTSTTSIGNAVKATTATGCVSAFVVVRVLL